MDLVVVAVVDIEVEVAVDIGDRADEGGAAEAAEGAVADGLLDGECGGVEAVDVVGRAVAVDGGPEPVDGVGEAGVVARAAGFIRGGRRRRGRRVCRGPCG